MMKNNLMRFHGVVWVYECISLLTGSSIFCAQKADDNKICMLNWVVDSHPEWKDLAKKVFDNDQFKFEAMFEEDFVERRTFHEYVMREETNVTFERGESSRQGEASNKKIPDYFLKFQELILTNNECLNNKLDLLIKEVESLKDMLKEKVNQIVENNDNIPRDDNNDEGLSTSSQKEHEERDFTFTVLRSPYTTKSDSTKPKKERIEFNAQGFEAPTFKLLSQDL
ncbi:uncharacterized protein E6C27_scaffold17G001390 [Cucumis melo var. makuwa]|uniref:Uncharacterized protein n=1 Tax=Cucumis melo var. makuwa TaxID=1194695 RepID=A0A5A7VB98_CUCMM|nr:uncharacterized protein E6C27_scaffold17G001390 [Cucumis melo var. makuwa]